MAHELVLNRLLDAPPEKLYRLWTDPSRMPEWFCPKPWTVSVEKMDLRPGGASHFTIRGPNGESARLFSADRQRVGSRPTERRRA